MNPYAASRRLLIFALVLLLAGFAASAAYWTIDSGAYLAIQEGYGDALSVAATADAEEAGVRAEAQWNRVNRSARLVETHAHLLFLSILLMLFALLLADPAVGGRGADFTVALAIGGVLIYPTGLLVQTAGLVLPGQALSAAGALLILAFVARIVAALLRRQVVPGGTGTSS